MEGSLALYCSLSPPPPALIILHVLEPKAVSAFSSEFFLPLTCQRNHWLVFILGGSLLVCLLSKRMLS